MSLSFPFTIMQYTKSSCRFLETGGLWRWPDARVVVLGDRDVAQTLLLHPALRNTLQPLYLATHTHQHSLPPTLTFGTHTHQHSLPIPSLDTHTHHHSPQTLNLVTHTDRPSPPTFKLKIKSNLEDQGETSMISNSDLCVIWENLGLGLPNSAHVMLSHRV